MSTAKFVDRALAVIRHEQQWMRTRPDPEDEERWGAALQPLGASIEGSVLVVQFVEPDGRRIDYRWLLADGEGYNALLEPDKSLESLASNFHEDVLTSQRHGPDAGGMRWFGDTE